MSILLFTFPHIKCSEWNACPYEWRLSSFMMFQHLLVIALGRCTLPPYINPFRGDTHVYLLTLGEKWNNLQYNNRILRNHDAMIAALR